MTYVAHPSWTLEERRKNALEASIRTITPERFHHLVDGWMAEGLTLAQARGRALWAMREEKRGEPVTGGVSVASVSGDVLVRSLRGGE